MKDQVKMIIYLHTIESPIQSKQIEERLGVSGEKLRNIINDLRQEPLPIGSDRRGYFFARNKAELQATIDNLEGREIGIRKARHGLENCFANENQLKLI